MVYSPRALKGFKHFYGQNLHKACDAFIDELFAMVVDPRARSLSRPSFRQKIQQLIDDHSEPVQGAMNEAVNYILALQLSDIQVEKQPKQELTFQTTDNCSFQFKKKDIKMDIDQGGSFEEVAGTSQQQFAYNGASGSSGISSPCSEAHVNIGINIAKNSLGQQSPPNTSRRSSTIKPELKEESDSSAEPSNFSNKKRKPSCTAVEDDDDIIVISDSEEENERAKKPKEEKPKKKEKSKKRKLILYCEEDIESDNSAKKKRPRESKEISLLASSSPLPSTSTNVSSLVCSRACPQKQQPKQVEPVQEVKLYEIVNFRCPVDANCSSDKGVNLSTPKAMRRHLSKAHSTKQYLCHVRSCGQSFDVGAQYIKHAATEHETLLCSDCDSILPTAVNLSSHYGLFHMLGEFRCLEPGCSFLSKTTINEVLLHRQVVHEQQQQVMKDGTESDVAALGSSEVDKTGEKAFEAAQFFDALDSVEVLESVEDAGEVVEVGKTLEDALEAVQVTEPVEPVVQAEDAVEAVEPAKAEETEKSDDVAKIFEAVEAIEADATAHVEALDSFLFLEDDNSADGQDVETLESNLFPEAEELPKGEEDAPPAPTATDSQDVLTDDGVLKDISS